MIYSTIVGHVAGMERGVEFAGYPKFIAHIDFVEDSDWITRTLEAENQNVLTLKGRILPLKQVPRYCLHPITYRRGYILRSEFVISERDMGYSNGAQGILMPPFESFAG